MTLTEYLVARGSKMLMPCEAKALGVPHPLERGWAARHGDLVLTMEQLHAIYQGIEGDRRPSAMKVRHGLLLAARDCLAQHS